MDKSNIFQNLLNFLKNTGSSGSQFSLSPTITNQQIGNSVKQINNAGLPTAITPSPISPMGINSILREGEINKVVNEAAPGTLMDFSNINKGGITWGDMYGTGKDGETSQFNVIKREKVTPDVKNKEPEKPNVGETDPDLDKKFAMLKEMMGMSEEMGNRGANRNLFRAQLASIPDLMLRGGEGVADIYSKQAQNTLAWASNLPKYNLPAMNYTALRNYGLGG